MSSFEKRSLMKPAVLAALLATLMALPGFAGEKDEKQCPLHEQHMKQAEAKSAEDLVQRGDRVMGFAEAKTTHHFVIRKNGGAIEVTADDPDDAESVGLIRTHLQDIAGQFRRGNFELPREIHSQQPAGATAMARLASKISYRFSEMDGGGRLTIQTRNPEALSAIHAFLRFQIDDHQTGDAH
jgi:hypothetical protein